MTRMERGKKTKKYALGRRGKQNIFSLASQLFTIMKGRKFDFESFEFENFDIHKSFFQQTDSVKTAFSRITD